MIGDLERRVSLKLFPSNPRHEGEVVDVFVDTSFRLPIRAKNLTARGEVSFAPDGSVIFPHNVARARPAPGSEVRFQFVDGDGVEEDSAGNVQREFRVQPGGSLGVWPKEHAVDRFIYNGRRFLRLEVASILTD